MKTLSNSFWRCDLHKLCNLALLFVFTIHTIAIAQLDDPAFVDPAFVDNTAYIDIQLNTENEAFVADYQLGDTPYLSVAVSQDSYIYVFSIDSDLRYAQIVPNQFEQNNYVYASQGTSYPSTSNYNFALDGMHGFTTLFAIASPRAIDQGRLERYIQKYILFAEAYNGSVKLSNVVIGPGIGSDISYLRVSGNQVATHAANNTVYLNPLYYQSEYIDNTYVVTNSGTTEEVYSENNLASSYTTPEYNEVLRSYQESLDVYSTYSDELAQSHSNQNGISNDTYTIRQTITLTGVDAAISNPTATTPVLGQSLQASVNITPFENWLALSPLNYSFVFHQECYCTEEYLYQMLVSVENGAVSRVQYLENNQDVPDYVFQTVPSIEDIFMGIAETRVGQSSLVDVIYNQDFSFPNRTYFVNDPATDADDLVYDVSYVELQ